MDTSSLAFWGILGGMLVVCISTVTIVYFMCFSRNRSVCMSEDEDLLETTVHHEEVHTVTSETRTGVSGSSEPELVHRTQQIRRVTTKQRSRGNLFQSQTLQPVTEIRVSPNNEKSYTQPSITKNNKSASNETSFIENLSSPRPGQSQLTSIGTSS